MKASHHSVSQWASLKSEPAWVGSETSASARFESVVAMDPDAPAYASPAGVRITYGELNQRANQLAHLLSDLPGEPAEVVGVLTRNPDAAITAMIGSLKSGRLYTVLDPADPRNRLERIVENSGTRLLLSEPEQEPMARALMSAGGEVLVIGREELDRPGSDLHASFSLDDLSYLIHTSGSTGLPKGVLHNQRNLLHKAEVARAVFGVGRDDRVSLLFSPATGAATSGIFGPLLNGGVVCPFDLKTDGLAGLGTWLNEMGVTVLHVVPTVLRRFLELGDRDEIYPHVRVVILPGEPTVRRDVELCRRRFGPETVLAPRLSSNETSVVAADHLAVGSEVSDDILTVGFPLEDKLVRLVDEAGQEVPVGTVGQIEIESEYLALGYWRDPRLTASKFRPVSEGRRIYRMGDLGRFRADGRLEFMGRSDDRLKISGVTIEPREVEKAMHTVGRFKELAVVSVETSDGGERLVAYAVLEDGTTLQPDIRSALRRLLPAAMVPTAVVVIDELPLTSLGKVDKLSLPAPSFARTDTVAPGNELETSLVAIWDEVLDVPGVGVTDDFFDLGGTSIQALEVFALIGRRLNVDVPSTTLLNAPTIRALADVIQSGDWIIPDSLVPVHPAGEETPFFCIHGGGGGVFFVRDLADHLAGNRPVYGLQARGFESRPGPYRSVEELAANYIAEISGVQPRGPYLLGGLSFGGKVAFEMAQQLKQAGEDVASVVLIDSRAHPTQWSTDLDRHRRRMSGLPLIGGARYLVRGVGRRLIRAAKRGLILYHLWRDRPIPDTLGLRNAYFYPMHSRANRAYVASDYPGRVDVIASAGKSQLHRDTWGRWARGGFSVVEVPADHAQLMDPPHVKEVARHLQEFLDEADPRS